MTFPHAIVWIDHRHAKVVGVSPDEARHTVVHNDGASQRVHHRAGSVGSGHPRDDHRFFDRVVAAIGDVPEVLIVGPGSAKQEFATDLAARHASVAKRVVGVEGLDHPTDGELVAYARKAFKRVDGLLGR